MNYYGINKKVPTVDTRWVGPKARLAAKLVEQHVLARNKELAHHTVTADADPRSPVGQRMIEHIDNKYGMRDGWITVWNTDNPFEVEVTITAPIGELIEEGLINE